MSTQLNRRPATSWCSLHHLAQTFLVLLSFLLSGLGPPLFPAPILTQSPYWPAFSRLSPPFILDTEWPGKAASRIRSLSLSSTKSPVASPGSSWELYPLSGPLPALFQAISFSCSSSLLSEPWLLLQRPPLPREIPAPLSLIVCLLERLLENGLFCLLVNVPQGDPPCWSIRRTSPSCLFRGSLLYKWKDLIHLAKPCLWAFNKIFYFGISLCYQN